MDNTFHTLDRHFHLPTVRRVEAARPIEWLKMGFADLKANPVASLMYGLVLAVAGYLILALAGDRPHVFTAAISGFLIIGPIAAAGLYEISRQQMMGQHPGFIESLKKLGSDHRESLFYCGLMLAFALIAWERISAILFALLYSGNVVSVADFASNVLFSGEHIRFTLAWIVAGGALAALVFAMMVVTIPMLMDRDIDMPTAMMTSLRAAASNLRAMALWAAIIVALVAVGFATMMVGLVIILPLLGHASWHAYKELVDSH